MSKRGRPITRIGIELANDEVLVLYKQGSRGEILAIYNSIKELTQKEKPYNQSFDSGYIYNVLSGLTKYIWLLHLQAKVLIRKKKISEVKELIK